jgi:hypothetical protein
MKSQVSAHGPMVVLAVVVAALAGCTDGTGPLTSTSASAQGSDGGSAATSLPACSWPVALDPTDAGDGRCRAARTLLSCRAGDVVEGCLSNDPTECPGPKAVPGPFTCAVQCDAHEYAIVCGAVGPAPFVPPPPGCRTKGAGPGGPAFYCCPCGG